MKPYLLAIFVAVASARPEPPVGYNYQAPSSGHFGGGGHPSIGGGAYSSGSIGGHSSGGSSFGGQSLGGGSFGGNYLGGGSFGGGFGNSGAGFQQGGGPGFSSGFDSSSSFPNGGGSFGGPGFGGQAAAGPSVHKHVYVHVAPEEPQEQHAPRVIPVAAPQKHYKIIFIKAPTAPTPIAPVIPAQPQNEEKTLVYVLVKKPEEQQDIVIPTAAPTQPSKPEVFFIRYKTEKEGVSGGLGAGIGGGIGGGSGLSGPGFSEGNAIFSGADLSGHGAGQSGLSGGHGASFPGAGSLSDSGNYASAGASSKYGPPGYHK